MTARSARPARPGTTSNRGLYLTLAAVAVIVVGLFGVAALVGGGDDDDTASGAMETAPVQVEGSLPPFPADAGGLADPATDPAVGESVPAVSGVSFDGTPVAITPDGTPRVLLFLAHWCPHCQREVPKVQDMVDDGRVPAGVEVVAISTSVRPDQGNHPPSRWLADEGWTSPVLVDDPASSAAQAYGLTAFPYGVYVDGDGRVVARTSGAVDADLIESLMGQLAQG
jgi:cytochrome c biogenesis protein CcmG, thiol:disulfide interchange protein DsbE